MAEVFLLGTIHLDIKSAPFLKAAILDCKPDLITVEISSYSVRYRQAMYPKWCLCLKRALKQLPARKRGHPQVKLLKRQITMPYEWSIAKRYADCENIPCLTIDSGELAKKELPCWEKTLLAADNVKFLVKEPWFSLESHFLECHKLASKLWNKPDPGQLHTVLAFLKEPFWQKRERIMATRLKRLSGLDYRLVHIGGWMHLLDGRGLPNLLCQLGEIVCEKKLISRLGD